MLKKGEEGGAIQKSALGMGLSPAFPYFCA